MASRSELLARVTKLERILIHHKVIFLVGDESILEGLETEEGDTVVLLQI